MVTPADVANAFPMLATVKALIASCHRSMPCDPSSMRASIASLCRLRCRQARHATRLIVRSGISKPSERNVPVHELAGLPVPHELTTAYTISLDAPDVMAKAAQGAASRALLKVKLGAEGDAARIAAVRAAAPHSTLIVDANEGWNDDNLAANFAACAEAGVTLDRTALATGKRSGAGANGAADSGLRGRERSRPCLRSVHSSRNTTR